MTQFSRADARVALGDAPRIAVVKLGALGDGVYAFPLVSALKAFRPAARLTWIVEARLADLPRLHPGVDEVVTVDTRGWRAALRQGRWRTAWTEFRAFRRAVAGSFDVAIDAQGLLKSAAVTWLTRAPIRVGFAPGDCRERGNAWAMTHHAAPVGAVHAVTKNLALPAALGVRVGAPTFEFRVPASDEAWASACTQVGAPLVTLHPGAGHPGKRWPLERWLTLSERLSATGPRVVIVTGPDDRAVVAEAVKAMPSAPAVAAPPTVGALAANPLARNNTLVLVANLAFVRWLNPTTFLANDTTYAFPIATAFVDYPSAPSIPPGSVVDVRGMFRWFDGNGDGVVQAPEMNLGVKYGTTDRVDVR